MLWVVNTNSNTCHIYAYHQSTPEMVLIKSFDHPEFKEKKSEFLTTDRPGRYQTSDGGQGAYEPHSDPKAIAIDNFSRDIAEFLNHARNNNDYESLLIIATPLMHGLLNHHLNKHVRDLIRKFIEKDLIHEPVHTLLPFIKEQIRYPDK